MPSTYKVLGQIYPSAATNTTLYTVPSSTQTVISCINVCNQSVTGDTISIAVRPAGEALATKHYVAYLDSVQGQTVYNLQIGITLNATDVVTIYSTNGTCSFNAYGSEIA